MMKSALLALPLSILVADAQAQSIQGTTGATCGEVRSIISNNGAAIVRWPSPRDPRVQLYGRFVASRALCYGEQVTATVYIPTADAPACPVLACQQASPDRFTGLNLARENVRGFEEGFGRDLRNRRDRDRDHDRDRDRDRDLDRDRDNGRDKDIDF